MTAYFKTGMDPKAAKKLFLQYALKLHPDKGFCSNDEEFKEMLNQWERFKAGLPPINEEPTQTAEEGVGSDDDGDSEPLSQRSESPSNRASFRHFESFWTNYGCTKEAREARFQKEFAECSKEFSEDEWDTKLNDPTLSAKARNDLRNQQSMQLEEKAWAKATSAQRVDHLQPVDDYLVMSTEAAMRQGKEKRQREFGYICWMCNKKSLPLLDSVCTDCLAPLCSTCGPSCPEHQQQQRKRPKNHVSVESEPKRYKESAGGESVPELPSQEVKTGDSPVPSQDAEEGSEKADVGEDSELEDMDLDNEADPGKSQASERPSQKRSACAPAAVSKADLWGIKGEESFDTSVLQCLAHFHLFTGPGLTPTLRSGMKIEFYTHEHNVTTARILKIKPDPLGLGFPLDLNINGQAALAYTNSRIRVQEYKGQKYSKEVSRGHDLKDYFKVLGGDVPCAFGQQRVGTSLLDSIRKNAGTEWSPLIV